jgi:hypothetical protein
LKGIVLENETKFIVLFTFHGKVSTICISRCLSISRREKYEERKPKEDEGKYDKYVCNCFGFLN